MPDPQDAHSADVRDSWEANAETWTWQSRKGYDIYRDALNTPAFLEMLPDVRGLAGLDLGCGEGSNTRRLARLGADMDAVDIAPTFIRHAMEAEMDNPLGIRYAVADAAALPFPDARFDFVASFMCMMDVASPPRALREVHRVLRPGGFLQFSILHPCFAPPRRRVLREEDGSVRGVELADYFQSGLHVETWWFSAASPEDRLRTPPFRVPYMHLTLSEWVDAVVGAGFVLRRMGEPTASEETARRVPEVADTRVVPLFLHIQALKPENRC